MRRLAQVERVAEVPPREDFERDYVARGRPVVIANALRAWSAIQAWTLDYLRARCATRPVTVTYSSRGVYSSANPRAMTLGQYIDILLSERPDREHYYLAGVGLDEALPELKHDVTRPDLVDPSAGSLSLFFGRNSRTGCHFHPSEQALFCQIVGEKRVVLYPPAAFSALYPKSFLAAHYNWSRLNLHEAAEPDERQYPRFRDAVGSECLVRSGEALFIPVHWWHLVHGPGVSISGTYFWPAALRDWHFPRPGMRCLFNRVLARYPRFKALIPRSIRRQ